ncbi:hypothetical protein HZF08_08495 [Paenibacillus sp. CGMCC 1.16610]|uniref:Copper amine oxidase-like N-terminal domain-containing protein n=1 Tax=Paenibacillus anseongense TaxID=2682845 RepID=A0ABW9UBE8_9BACL|nr:MULTISPECIES: hypothetical protein [Paenibacillus]MBA2938346.1 hypothetical protein [Paenibacillus sp. CGMCC 1.16610]MVQ37404.1 hypothetical protein [Paenibacillus anseongense]
MMKIKLFTFTVVAAAMGLAGYVSQAAADTIYGGSFAPEGLRFPAEIELLADTPYYAAADTYNTDPEGTFAPQTVHVLKTESAWSIGEATWKIETMFGPRWIRPKPWEIEIAPPKRITLLDETPLYRSPSTKNDSVAALSPQEVEVTDAEKMWFYTNDPNRKSWIKVHTNWLGDLWAFIPINQIGTVHDVHRKAHYNNLPVKSDLGAAMGIGQQQMDWSSTTAGDFTILHEFTTIYDRAFEVQTNQGTVWTRDKGVTILPADETLKIVRETPLFPTVFAGVAKEDAVLKDEMVTVFEKIAEPLWTGRGPYEIWHNSTWYHVRSSKGTGWINKLVGEPESAVPVHWKMLVRDARELSQYPEVPFTDTTLLLRNQTVEVTEAWNPPNGGSMWLKIHVDNRTGWIPFWNGTQDTLWDEDSQTIAHVAKTETNGVNIRPTGTGDLQLNTGVRIGYTDKGESYLNVNELADLYHYEVSTASGKNEITLTKGDYSFDLQANQASAAVHWQEEAGGNVPLDKPAQLIEGGWYLNLTDVLELFGLTQVVAGNEYSLFEKNYTVMAENIPTSVKSGRLELQAFVNDWTSREDYDAGQMPLQLSIEEGEDRGGIEHNSVNKGIVNQPDQSSGVALFSLKASRPLAVGTHQLDVVLRIGERIIWKKSVEIAAK